MALHFINILLISDPVNKQDLFLKFILPLIGPGLVVFTFYKNYKKDRKNKRKEAKRAWYFKAYFEPSIKRVETFFEDSAQLMDESINQFNSDLPKTTMQERVTSVSITLGSLSAKKRRFLIEVVEVLKLSYELEAVAIEDILNDFEDAGPKVFGDLSKKVSRDSFYVYLSEITILKAQLIKTLSRPALLLNKKNSKLTDDAYFDPRNTMV